MNVYVSAPGNIGNSTYVCEKSLDYNGHHFERFICYSFGNSWYGDMIINGTYPYEEIPIEIFRKHFSRNHLCKPGEDLRNCEICKHRIPIHCCKLHKSCYNKVKFPGSEHCEDFKYYGKE